MSRHIIVGTAGHVDHGKTELTARLTGINTDRLPEEKKRGMTIVPGFVPLDLDNGLRLGLIDVPGHERFVKNMLAGVAGIDMVLLVVAADEGVMPQTVEHLNILHLLDIDKGVVAITKCDLAEDEEWLNMIRDQVRELIAPTSLKNAPIIPCSAVTGEGIDELRQKLADIAATVEARPSSGLARLPVDRVFSKAGFGTVVTGTMWMGQMRLGDTVEIWPGGRTARIRGLQVHGAAVETAAAGQRTAVNLSGVEQNETPRGSWLAATGLLKESYRLDVELRLLAQARALPHRCRVRVHHGTAEVLARVQLLDREKLEPGESCYCQLLLETPLPPLRKDKLILRSYSPMITIAGATVLDADPQRHKRYNDAVMQTLAAKAAGDPLDALRDVLRKETAPVNRKQLAKDAQLAADLLDQELAQLTEQQRVMTLSIDGESHYLLPELAAEKLAAAQKLLGDFHARYPLRGGLPAAELRARLLPAYTAKQLSALLEAWRQEKGVAVNGALVALPDFRVQPTEQQQKMLEQLEAAYRDHLFEPPEWAELCRSLKLPEAQAGELLAWLTERGKLTRIGELIYHGTAADEAVKRLRALDAPDGFTLAAARDALGSSRKFVLPLLEALDTAKITVRDGDLRRFAGATVQNRS